MADDGAPFVRVDTGPAPGPGWHPDGNGSLRWWDGHGWTKDVAATHVAGQAAGLAAGAAIPRRRRWIAWWVAGAVATGLVLVGGVSAAVVLVAHTALDGSAGSGTPGYSTFTGRKGLPMQMGAPWGHPCVPVVLSIEDHVPQAVDFEIRAVVTEARSAGLNVAVDSRQIPWSPDAMDVRGEEYAEFVSVSTDTVRGHLRSDGKPSTNMTIWHSVPAPDRRHEHLTAISQTMHLATVGEDPVEYRRVIRKLVGWAHGISDSTRPGSALALGDAWLPDRFSADDIAAMKVMSGCD